MYKRTNLILRHWNKFHLFDQVQVKVYMAKPKSTDFFLI